MKFGDFSAQIDSINISISADRPAVFTRLKYIEDETKPNVATFATHAIRLNNPDSTRIGFDELRGAFPTQLAGLNDEELLTLLMSDTNTFIGKAVTVGVEQQMSNGVPKKAANGSIYFNVRLRSAVKNLGKTEASSLAKRLLCSVNTAQEVDKAFADSHPG